MSCVVDKINEFRRVNGVALVFSWNGMENDNCQAHAMFMSHQGRAFHAPDCLLHGKAEAVAICDFMNSTSDTVGHIIFELFGKSRNGHKDVLLMPNIAYGILVHHWEVYLVIRGW